MRDTALENDQLAKFLKDDSASREILVSEAQQQRDPRTCATSCHGFAIHHAGMTRAEYPSRSSSRMATCRYSSAQPRWRGV